MTEEERQEFEDIIFARKSPRKEAYDRGYWDHVAERGFHENPFPHESPDGISWRIGWNDCALEER